jgi:DNA-binding NarL/FixJ family response regulator
MPGLLGVGVSAPHLGVFPTLRPRRGRQTAGVPESPKTVFVVDDHPAFRASARLLLESEGYEVIGEAGDGETALVAIAELAPAIVVLDVQLPGIDGFDVAERLHARAGGSRRPLTVLVSSREASDFGPLLDSEAIAGFISKADLSGDALAELLP